MITLYVGESALNSLLVYIVSIIYHFVAQIMKLFVVLSEAEILDSSVYMQLVKNFYLILGVGMLFVIAFSLLKVMVDPESSKGTEETTGIIKKFITSILLLIFLPTIFSFAFSFQSAVVRQGTIGKIFGNNVAVTSDDLKSVGATMANSVFLPFFQPTEEFVENECNGVNDNECLKKIKAPNYIFKTALNDSSNLYETIEAVNSGKLSFAAYADYGDSIKEGDVSFNFILSLFCGIFMIYVVFSFCFDLGLRYVKLLFYQVIAPIPLFFRIVPNSKISDTFNQWVKVTVTCYLEVFIRLFVIYFGVWLCGVLLNEDNGIFRSNFASGDGAVSLFANLVIVLSILTFMKQAPKLIGEAFGFDSSNIKLGLSEKLGGLFAAGGAVGSLIASKGNPLAAIRGWKNGIGNIGAEAKRRKDYDDARKAGVTKRQMLKDYMLNKAGFESSYDRENSELEDKKFKVTNSSDSPITYKDINGEEHTINSEGESELDKNDVENLNARKRELSSNIAGIREKISMRNDQNSQNDDIISGRKAFKDEYEKKVREGEYNEGTYYYWKKVGSNWEQREYKGDINSIENFYKNFLTAEEQEYSNANRFEVVDSETGESKWVGGETMKEVFDRFGEEYAKSGKNQKVTAGINEALEAAAAEGAKTEFFDYEYNENGIRTGEILKTTMKVTKQDGKYVAKVVVTKSDGTIISETEPIDDALEIISKRDKLAKADSTYLNSLNAQDSRLIAPQEDEMKAIDSIVAQYNDAIESYKDREEFKRKEISSKYIANRNNNNK